MGDFLTVGGERVDIILRYVDVIRFRTKFTVLVDLSNAYEKRGRVYNWNSFTFWCLWECLSKKDKKRFGSKKKMIKSILFDEYEPIVSFINNEAMGIKKEDTMEDRETKNEPKAV